MNTGLLPESWHTAIRTGNSMIDIARKAAAGNPGYTFDVEYLLPLEPRFPPPCGRFTIAIPQGSKLTNARKVDQGTSLARAGERGGERLGALGLTFAIPKIKTDPAPMVFCVVSGSEEVSPPPAGIGRRLVGALPWRGSYRVLAEEKA